MASSGQKVVLITGCSSGIGLRIAVTLAKDEKKRYHGKCAFFYIVSLIGPISSEPMDVWVAWKPIPCLLFPAVATSLLYAQSSFRAQRSVWTQMWFGAASIEVANLSDNVSISLCEDWDSVTPSAQPLSCESAVSRVGLWKDVACQAES